MIKDDDKVLMSYRARRYVRGIALAMTLTFFALLFLFATLYGESRGTDALANPEASWKHEHRGSAPQTTGGITPVRLPNP